MTRATGSGSRLRHRRRCGREHVRDRLDHLRGLSDDPRRHPNTEWKPGRLRDEALAHRRRPLLDLPRRSVPGHCGRHRGRCGRQRVRHGPGARALLFRRSGPRASSSPSSAPTGTLLYALVFGGQWVDTSAGAAIAVDAQGHAYVTGYDHLGGLSDHARRLQDRPLPGHLHHRRLHRRVRGEGEP